MSECSCLEPCWWKFQFIPLSSHNPQLWKEGRWKSNVTSKQDNIKHLTFELHFTGFYQPRQHIKRQRHYLVNKGPSSQGCGFSSGHVWMWELDYKESWAPKNWCFWIVVLEKTLESPVDCKEIQPVHPKGHQSWVFIGRTDFEVATPIPWPPYEKSWLIWKDPDAGKHWGQEEKGTTEDEMAGWHHRLNGREFELTPGVGDGQGGLVCCSSWGCKESDTTEQLNWTELTV